MLFFPFFLWLFYVKNSLLFLRVLFSILIKKDDKEAEEFADVIETVFHNKEGRIKYQGTTWSARSLSEEIPAGSMVRVLRREGLTYIVEKAEK
ncbi:hypothetical protein HMPREF9353_01614 [Treponema denticola F0402]|nr:hypothetical protein HMPREF9353_01614 [Treponema denticola F0402]